MMAAPRQPSLSPTEPTPRLSYAGLPLRIVAFVLDVMVLVSSWVVFFLGSAALFILLRTDFLDRDPTDGEFYVALAITVIGYVLFLPLYHILLWALWGQTLGMMAVRIRVVNLDGGRISLARSVLRLVAYAASVLPLFLGLAVALFNPERRALHDLLAGTVVIELP